MTELEKLKEEIVIAAKALADNDGDEEFATLQDAVEALEDYEPRQNGH